jgi:hypothetical protein
LESDEFSRLLLQRLINAPKAELDIPTFDISGLHQAGSEFGQCAGRAGRRVHKTDLRDIGSLLRPRRQWPRRRAAEQRDEVAASLHSITWSAVASNVGGIERPSALRVFVLMIPVWQPEVNLRHFYALCKGSDVRGS